MAIVRPSISLRLTFWFGSIFLLGWVLFGATMWLNLKHTLTEERHLTLRRRADRLEEVLLKTRAGGPSDRQQDFRDFSHATGGGLAEIFRPDGSRFYPSPSAAARGFPWPTVRSEARDTLTQVLAPDQPYWVLTRRSSIEGSPVYLQVAAPEAGNLLVLDRFWEGLLASAPVLLLISSIGGYWLSGRALKPVDRITATARSISIRNLSDRVPVVESGDELQRLAETCNAMLARLESAVHQINRFTADASHELRGPISFVRTVAEVALRNTKADATSLQAFQEIVDETAKAAVLLEDMLTLARADAGTNSATLVPLNLADIVDHACEIARPLAAGRSLALSLSSLPARPILVMGDLKGLRQLIWILLDNALKYTQANGHVAVEVDTDYDSAIVKVRDDGRGIAEADLPHIFDRFYRADPSRSDVEGTGLGLAIAKWIAEQHHADLSVSSELRSGSVFRIAIPLCSKTEPGL